ncbi:MAG: hypothetical protein ACW99A_06625 [Candidatus Kariarchaeaceae archaeon]|jgi:hypothetical protein
MENTLLKLFKKEKLRQVRTSILLAVLVSASVLAISFVAFDLFGDDDPGIDINNNPDPTGNDYVLKLNSYLDEQYTGGKVSAFLIHGNTTASIHPTLLSSEVVPSGMDWEVNALVVKGAPDMVEQTSFQLTGSEMDDTHQSFLSSLDKTSEVEPPEPQDLPSAQLLLVYVVLYEDGTGIEFAWLGFQDFNILGVQNVTWGGSSTSTTSTTTSSETSSEGSGTTTTSIPHLSQAENDYSYTSNTNDVKYISPLSAFDDFINKLQELYSPHLEG